MNELSGRERTILILLACGHDAVAIARVLSLSVRTIENHLYALRAKLAQRNASDDRTIDGR
ncbi:MAG: hypothetical protein NVS2B3_17710 [Vulcanimicrobiaceae bacterium]